jgi:hypothetical protein
MQEDIGTFKRFFIQQGGGICRLLLGCYIVLSFISIFASYALIERNRYGEAVLSNWRLAKDFKLDYSTNIVCYYQYSGRWCDIMRIDNYEDFKTRLQRGDTLLIGLDYYALMGISSYYFDPQWLRMYSEHLIEGNVMVWQINKNFSKRLL